MAKNYDLNNTGPEVQARLDQVFPNQEKISAEEQTRAEADAAMREELKAYTDAEKYRAQEAETALSDRTTALEEQVGSKPYTPADYIGMGRTYLQKNVKEKGGVTANWLEQSMLTEPNTIYVVQYDYTISQDNGNTITLPEGCVLVFDGGSFCDGTLDGNGGSIVADDYEQVFNGVVLSGTFANDHFSIVHWGVQTGIDNAAVNGAIIRDYVTSSMDNVLLPLVIPQGIYHYGTPIVFSGLFDLDCQGTLIYTGENVATALTIGRVSAVSKEHTYRVRLTTTNGGEQIYDQQGNVPESYGLRMVNIQDSVIHLESVHDFAYDVTFVGDGGNGFIHNKIFVGLIGRKHFVAMKLLCTGGGWVNENLFLGGHFRTGSTNNFDGAQTAIWISGSEANSSNNNVFVKPCTEKHHVAVKLSGAQKNTFIAVRNEGCANTLVVDDETSKTSKENLLLSYTVPNEGTSLQGLGYSFAINKLGEAVLKPVFEFSRPENFITASGNNSYKQSTVAVTSLGESISNRTNGVDPLYGHILDVSETNTLYITTDAPDPDRASIYVEVLDDENNVMTFDERESVLEYSYAAVFSGSYIRCGKGGKLMIVKFTAGVKRVFVGMDKMCNRIRVTTPDDNPNIIADGDIGTRLTTIPDTVENTKYGFRTMYNKQPVIWTGNTSIGNKGWVNEDGSIPGFTTIVDETNVPRFFIGGNVYASAVVTARPGYDITDTCRTNPHYGHILDVSAHKEYIIESDDGYTIIMVIDAGNKFVEITDIDDYVERFTGSVQISSGYLRLSSSTIKTRIVFKEGVTRIFIGIPAVNNFLKISSLGTDINAASILDDGNLGKVLSFIPAVVENTPAGYATLYDSRKITWDGLRWVDDNGYTANPNRGTTRIRNTLIAAETLAFATTDAGFQYFDTDLQKPVFLKITGTGEDQDPYVYAWVDATGNDPDAA